MTGVRRANGRGNNHAAFSASRYAQCRPLSVVMLSSKAADGHTTDISVGDKPVSLTATVLHNLWSDHLSISP